MGNKCADCGKDCGKYKYCYDCKVKRFPPEPKGEKQSKLDEQKPERTPGGETSISIPKGCKRIVLELE